MAKAGKPAKKKIPASIKIDPDLYERAVEKCLRESLSTKTRVTFSSKVEDLVRDWVSKK
jgi:hypothetical protein